MRPITKNIIVVDEFGKEYTSTYAKRAKGLVKNGRARWLDGNTICLVCPPDTLNLEDNEMENRAENMEIINAVCENQVIKEESVNAAGNKKEQFQAVQTQQEEITAADILSRIDMIIAQGDNLQRAVAQIHDLPVNDSPYGGEDGAQRAEAIANIYNTRETTNQKMIDLLNRMYEDITYKQRPDDMLSARKIEAVEKLAGMDFAGVSPGTADKILNFINDSLM